MGPAAAAEPEPANANKRAADEISPGDDGADDTESGASVVTTPVSSAVTATTAPPSTSTGTPVAGGASPSLTTAQTAAADLGMLFQDVATANQARSKQILCTLVSYAGTCLMITMTGRGTYQASKTFDLKSWGFDFKNLTDYEHGGIPVDDDEQPVFAWATTGYYCNFDNVPPDQLRPNYQRLRAWSVKCSVQFVFKEVDLTREEFKLLKPIFTYGKRARAAGPAGLSVLKRNQRQADRE